MNRKGNIPDLLVYMIFLFAIAIVIVVAQYTWNEINTPWQADPNIPQVSKDIVSHQTTKFRPVWDGFMVAAVLGYLIAIIILAASIRSHPVFAMLGFIVLVVFGIIGVHLSNAFDGFATTSELASTSSTFVFTIFIMNNLPLIIIICGAVFLIVLYAKNQDEGVSL